MEGMLAFPQRQGGSGERSEPRGEYDRSVPLPRHGQDWARRAALRALSAQRLRGPGPDGADADGPLGTGLHERAS